MLLNQLTFAIAKATEEAKLCPCYVNNVHCQNFAEEWNCSHVELVGRAYIQKTGKHCKWVVTIGLTFVGVVSSAGVVTEVDMAEPDALPKLMQTIKEMAYESHSGLGSLHYYHLHANLMKRLEEAEAVIPAFPSTSI